MKSQSSLPAISPQGSARQVHSNGSNGVRMDEASLANAGKNATSSRRSAAEKDKFNRQRSVSPYRSAGHLLLIGSVEPSVGSRIGYNPVAKAAAAGVASMNIYNGGKSPKRSGNGNGGRVKAFAPGGGGSATAAVNRGTALQTRQILETWSPGHNRSVAPSGLSRKSKNGGTSPNPSSLSSSSSSSAVFQQQQAIDAYDEPVLMPEPERVHAHHHLWGPRPSEKEVEQLYFELESQRRAKQARELHRSGLGRSLSKPWLLTDHAETEQEVADREDAEERDLLARRIAFGTIGFKAQSGKMRPKTKLEKRYERLEKLRLELRERHGAELARIDAEEKALAAIMAGDTTNTNGSDGTNNNGEEKESTPIAGTLNPNTIIPSRPPTAPSSSSDGNGVASRELTISVDHKSDEKNQPSLARGLSYHQLISPLGPAVRTVRPLPAARRARSAGKRGIASGPQVPISPGGTEEDDGEGPFVYSGNIGIFVSCNNLIQMDLLSKSDPAVAVYEKNAFSGAWIYYQQTETLKDNHEPRFFKQFLLEFDTSLPERDFRFSVYDVDRHVLTDLMGYVDIRLNELATTLLEREERIKQNAEDSDSGSDKEDRDGPARFTHFLINPENARTHRRLLHARSEITLECRLFKVKRAKAPPVAQPPSII